MARPLNCLLISLMLPFSSAAAESLPVRTHADFMWSIIQQRVQTASADKTVHSHKKCAASCVQSQESRLCLSKNLKAGWAPSSCCLSASDMLQNCWAACVQQRSVKSVAAPHKCFPAATQHLPCPFSCSRACGLKSLMSTFALWKEATPRMLLCRKIHFACCPSLSKSTKLEQVHLCLAGECLRGKLFAVFRLQHGFTSQNTDSSP